MTEEQESSRLLEDVRAVSTWIGETIFVLAAIILGLILVGALIGLNPLSTPVTIAALIVIPVIFVGRTRWYRRNRDNIERSGVPHARRERRGF